MTASDAIDIIKLAKNATRGAALGLFGISVGVAFIFILTTSPEEDVIDLISSIMTGAIIMLAAHVSLHLLYKFAKDQERETVKEPEEIKEESDT